MKALTSIICLSSRSFPLSSILVLVALTSCCVIQPGTELVFNTLATDCIYDRLPETGVSKQGPPVEPPNFAQASAVRFTAWTSDNLATVHLGLTNNEVGSRIWGGPVNVFFCRDASGSPAATQAQTYLGTVAPTESLWTTNKSIVSLVVARKVPVVQGLDYWLVLKPAPLGPPGFDYMIDHWHFFNDHTRRPIELPAFAITAWPPPLANFFREQPGAYGR